jgi:hypothetical protein
MHSPTCTKYLQTGGATKSGGFVVVQGVGGSIITADDFKVVGKDYGMVGTYGTDATSFSDGGFIFASQLSIDVENPYATDSGIAYSGYTHIGNLVNLSIANLIKVSIKSTDPAKTFKMHGAIVNNDIVFKRSKILPIGVDGEVAAEYVHYYILH